MKLTLTLLLILFGLKTFGQKVYFDTLIIPENQKLNELQSKEMFFPLIRTGNSNIDSLINFDLKNQFTDNEYIQDSIDSTIIKWASDQLIYLDFNVTYNKDGIVSFNISAEGCGAYCTFWTDYFNYSTITGKQIGLDDFINLNSNFYDILINENKKQYKQQLYELKEMFQDKDSGLDQDTYKIAVKYYRDCWDSFKAEKFALHSDHFEIIENCYLPNIMKNLTPEIKLKFKYSEINKYLKVKN